jgi:esterase/lipase
MHLEKPSLAKRIQDPTNRGYDVRAAFREWEGFKDQRFAELRAIRHPTLVVNLVHDEMIPVSNSYRLSENLANAVLDFPDQHICFFRRSGI